MKSQELIYQIKNLLGMEENIQLAQLKLENGTVLEADSFEQNMEVFILSDDERISLPVGEYQLEDGRTLKVEDEGVISEIGMNEHYEDKDKEEKEEEKEDKDKEKMEYVTKEEFRKEMDELRKHIEDMMKHKDKEKEKEKEEMASQVATEIAVEMSKQPAAKAIKHSPENKEDKKKFVFAEQRTQTTLDRIMNKLANK